MRYTSTTEIKKLVNQFEKRTLPKSSWTHDAHLTVAIYYLLHHNFFESLCLVRARIITYNEAVGGVNSATSGYHETLTVFWLTIINGYLANEKHKELDALCNEFLASASASKELPFSYYSKERLLSTEARAQWVEPDLKALDGTGRRY